jgi:SAM-dependent methyltransferase
MTDVAYDWDDYGSDFRDSPVYAAQEATIKSFLRELPDDAFANVLEVGPGFGRITKIIVDAYGSLIENYRAVDVSPKALEAAQAYAGRTFSDVRVAAVQDADEMLNWPKSSLVIAIEVLLHVPPGDVFSAIVNLLDATAPDGWLITCDWTVDLGSTPIRRDNHRHDYPKLLHAAGAREITSSQLGLQTIYRSRP